jgi:hypothetical protein
MSDLSFSKWLCFTEIVSLKNIYNNLMYIKTSYKLFIPYLFWICLSAITTVMHDLIMYVFTRIFDLQSFYRKSSLSLDQQLEIYLPTPVHCWLPNHHLVTQWLLAYLDHTAYLAWLVILEIHVNTIHSDVNYSVQKLNMVSKSNYSYVIILYNILHDRNVLESFVGSILTLKYHVMQQFTIM